MKKIMLFILVSVILLSCEQSKKTKVVQENPVVDIPIVTNERDPICDMAIKGNLSDTALIDGKVWGFCSSACKEKYLNSK